MIDQIENRLAHIHWSTCLYNTSLTELKIISDETYTGEEIKIVNSHTFNFYRGTLQYCFIMEYCKLLESGSTKKEQNISSLNKLNEIFLEKTTKDFHNRHYENIKLLEKIRGSNFYKKMKTLRDKKFSHADNDEINEPFKFKAFITVDFENAFEHLRIIKIIFNNFGSVFGRIYDLEIPSRDDRTRNFIKFQSEYQTYFNNNN